MAGTLRNLGIADAPIPEPKTPADYDRKYRQTAKGKENRARQKQSYADRAYLAKEFVAWDGEGYNKDDGTHVYNLLASSDGNRLTNVDGIPTHEAFDLFLAGRTGVINIIYGGSYDFNMILRDMSREHLEHLYHHGFVKWHGYFVKWKRGKSLNIHRDGHSVIIYDILPFFQRTFVQACDEYLGTDWDSRDQIILEKQNRGKFTVSDIANVQEYNDAELRNTVRLAEELRERLHRVGIRISRWDGPGAIATSLYQKYRTKSHYGEIPNEVGKAARHAYAGGRFEIIRKGHSESGAYQYDINSAYPSAARELPCLAHGKWIHNEYLGKPTRIARFGVYRIDLVNPQFHETQPQPLWVRNKNGTVYFYEYCHGWYWSPEAQLAKDTGGATFYESWEWIQTCDHKPFWFIDSLYEERARLKAMGDGAHVGIKLGLNSLYGKLAQQVGWNPGPPLRIPPYHSLEWAGYITSHCRANVYRAALHAPDDIISFETDAVFSRVPLPVDLGSGLGQWERTEYSSLTYFKSGMSFGTLVDGTETRKTRGINKGTLSRQQVIDALREYAAGESVTLEAEQTRFITLGQALHQDFSLWTRWITKPRQLHVYLNGKRMDLYDNQDLRWQAEKDDGWEQTTHGLGPIAEFSYPYEIAWIEKTDMGYDGLSMDEIREMDYDGDVETYGYE